MRYTAPAGTLFTSILNFPPTLPGPFKVTANGASLGTFNFGDQLAFPGEGVQEFVITSAAPLIANTPFPMQLGFDTAIACFSTTLLPDGDYNLDGTVDAGDYVLWRDSLDQMGARLSADGNDDGIVNQADFDIWRAHFGETVAVGLGLGTEAPVPEPSVITSVVLGIGWMLACRRMLTP